MKVKHRQSAGPADSGRTGNILNDIDHSGDILTPRIDRDSGQNTVSIYLAGSDIIQPECSCIKGDTVAGGIEAFTRLIFTGTLKL